MITTRSFVLRLTFINPNRKPSTLSKKGKKFLDPVGEKPTYEVRQNGRIQFLWLVYSILSVSFRFCTAFNCFKLNNELDPVLPIMSEFDDELVLCGVPIVLPHLRPFS
jgi:hypothetical protein